MPSSFRTLAVDMNGEDVRAVQTCLKKLRYGVGIADGKFGKRTEAAVKAYQRDIGRPDTGVVTPGTWNALATEFPDILLRAVDDNGNDLLDDVVEIHDTAENCRSLLTEAFDHVQGILFSWLGAYHAFREILRNVPVRATRPDFGKVFESQIKNVVLEGVKALVPSYVTTVTSQVVGLLDGLANELTRARTAQKQLEVNNWILNNEGRLTDIIAKLPDSREPTIRDLTQWYRDHPGEQTRLVEAISNQLSNLKRVQRDHKYNFLTIAYEFIKSFNGHVTLEIKAADWKIRGGLIPWYPVENWTVRAARIEDLPKVDGHDSGELIADKMKEYYPNGINFDVWGIRRIFYFDVGGAVEPGWITPGLPDTGYTIEYDESGNHTSAYPGLPDNFPWNGWVQRFKAGFPPTPNISGPPL